MPLNTPPFFAFPYSLYAGLQIGTFCTCSTLLNGWGANAHVGSYESGVAQSYNFTTDPGTTNAYNNPGNAFDGNNTTYADATYQATHQYAGCVWQFSNPISPTIPSRLVLNILSEVPYNGENSLIINNRSAGMWYSVDSGSTWVQIYNQPTRAKQWDCIQLPLNTDPTHVQVMAFIDSHDDMAHYIYEIQLGIPTGNYGHYWPLNFTGVAQPSGATKGSGQIFPTGRT